MITAEKKSVSLERGDTLTRDEFLSRWEAMPEVKRAELIGGVVYMPSPLSLDHAVTDTLVAGWLLNYKSATPGCQTGQNATTLMLDDSPQPDVFLRLLPEVGGTSRVEGKYLSGAPELVAEICLSSTSYDLHQKMRLYEEAGVREYVTVLIKESEVRWHSLRDGRYQRWPNPDDGIYKSQVFPGLSLDFQALLADDSAKLLEVLRNGLHSDEHARFVADLDSRLKSK